VNETLLAFLVLGPFLVCWLLLALIGFLKSRKRRREMRPVVKLEAFTKMQRHTETYDTPPGSRPLCRWCWGPVGKGRQSWCSAACVEEYRNLYDWQHIRRCVRRRDQGVCSLCGCDTEKIVRVIDRARRIAKRLGWYDWMDYRDLRPSLFGTKRGGHDLWEADHIEAREHGGTNAIENLRTLCVGCHQDVTSAQAKERAEARKVRGRSLWG
jgi:5-methylcytosine-specific restriction enzyme A